MSGANQAALVVTPHPLTLADRRLYMPTEAPIRLGETLAEFVGRYGVTPGAQWVVEIGGVQVPEQRWHLVRPKHGHLIEARRVPEKDVLRVVAIAALSYFTFGAGGLGAGEALGGSFLGLSGVSAYAAAGALFLDGYIIRHTS